MKEITINKTEDGIRASKYIKKLFPTMPDSLIYKLFRKKYFVLNGKKLTGNETVASGDRLKIFLGDDTYDKYAIKNDARSLKKKDLSFGKSRILYEDDNIIIFDKPSGILSQGEKKDDISVNSILLNYINGGKDKLFTPSIVNRLDRNTSGLIIFAKTYIAAREISKMIKEQRLAKHYKALVNGIVKKDSGTLINLYKKDEKNNKAIIKDASREINGYKEIRLKYSVIKRNKDTTLLDIDLITGKSHQIRAQLSYIGHPIVCDKKYMDTSLYRDNVEKYGVRAQELCCYKLIFGDFENEELRYLNGKVFNEKV